MFPPEFRSLVVDDNPIARATLGRALERQGFHCQYARDGEDALTLLAATTFDLVVTDLRMPNMNGHTLAVETLSRPQPPLVAVCTAVTDPRLRDDLLARGVDRIVHKPADLESFALQMKRSVLSRTRNAHLRSKIDELATCGDLVNGQPIALPIERINGGEYEQRLATVNQLFPLSAASNEVHQLASRDSTSQHTLACSVLKDAGLTAEILRIANSAFYLRTNPATIDLTEAITRLGYRRVGEIALALHVSAALRSKLLPWFDADLAQLRCLAASIAVNCVSEFYPSAIATDVSTLAALLIPLDRLVMGTAFQVEYRQLLDFSKRSGWPLRELESQVFPEDPTTALSRVVSKWRFSEMIWRPLRHVGESYEKLSQLEEPLRTRVELLKLCVSFGEFAVGRWLPWETIPVAPENLLHKYQLSPVSNIVERTRNRLERIQLPSQANVTPAGNSKFAPTFRFDESAAVKPCES